MLTIQRAILLAALVLAAAIVAHSAIPRYEVRASGEHGTLLRIDRWSGTVVEIGSVPVIGEVRPAFGETRQWDGTAWRLVPSPLPSTPQGR